MFRIEGAFYDFCVHEKIFSFSGIFPARQQFGLVNARQDCRHEDSKNWSNGIMSDIITHDDDHDGIDRRGFLKCMAWAGTGVLWTISGGKTRQVFYVIAYLRTLKD